MARTAAKITRMLANLVVADLGAAFEFTNADGAPTGFQFKDRMTRREAERLIRFVREDRGELATQIREAYQDKNHPAHAYARTIGGVVNHFALEHAQDASGAPVAWTEREPPTWDPKGEQPFAAFNAEEAAALLEWSKVQPGDKAAMHDKSHPAHEAHTKLIEQLYAVANPSGGALAPAAEANGLTLEQHERVREIQNNEAYRDKSHPSHKALVDEMSEIYAEAFPPSPPGIPAPAAQASPRPSPAPTKGAGGALSGDQRRRLAELQSAPAYRDKRDPGHAAAVEAVSGVFREAYPEPAPAPTSNEGGAR